MSLPAIIAISVGLSMLALLLAITSPAADLQEQEETGEEPKDFFDTYIKPTLRTFLPQSQLEASLKSSARGKYKEILDRSGNPWKITPAELHAFKFLGLTIGTVGGILLWITGVMPMPGWIAAIALIYVGYEYPTSILKSKAKQRLKLYDRALPEFMDLVVINMKAGRTLESAIAQTVEKMPPNALRAELNSVMKIVRTGAPLRTTMEAFAARTGSDDIQAFIKSIALSQQSGGDPSETISHQAEIMRDQRMYKLEKKTSSLSSYLTGVMIGTMIPALLIILGGPGMVQIVNYL